MHVFDSNPLKSNKTNKHTKKIQNTALSLPKDAVIPGNVNCTTVGGDSGGGSLIEQNSILFCNDNSINHNHNNSYISYNY